MDILPYLSCSVFVVSSLFGNKITGLTIFGVLQLAYLSLSQYSYINIYMRALLSLGNSNGFNLSPATHS